MTTPDEPDLGLGYEVDTSDEDDDGAELVGLPWFDVVYDSNGEPLDYDVNLL